MIDGVLLHVHHLIVFLVLAAIQQTINMRRGRLGYRKKEKKKRNTHGRSMNN